MKKLYYFLPSERAAWERKNAYADMLIPRTCDRILRFLVRIRCRQPNIMVKGFPCLQLYLFKSLQCMSKWAFLAHKIVHGMNLHRILPVNQEEGSNQVSCLSNSRQPTREYEIPKKTCR